jgi:hypothetical protein
MTFICVWRSAIAMKVNRDSRKLYQNDGRILFDSRCQTIRLLMTLKRKKNKKKTHLPFQIVRTIYVLGDQDDPVA